MLQILETGKALYVLAAICGLGILTRLITGRLYKRLLKESTNLAMTKNKRLKELRQRAENTYRMNQGLRDSGAWLEHQLYELRFMGMTLAGWSTLSMQWTWLCLLAGAVGAFASYWYRLDTFYIVLYGGGAVMMAMLTMLFDLGAGSGRKEQLVSSLKDYLENVMCPRLARNQPLDGGLAETDRAGGNRMALNARTFSRDRRSRTRFSGEESIGADRQGAENGELDGVSPEGAGLVSGAEGRFAAGTTGYATGATGGLAAGAAGTAAALSSESVVNGGRAGESQSGRRLSNRAARRAAAAARAGANIGTGANTGTGANAGTGVNTGIGTCAGREVRAGVGANTGGAGTGQNESPDSRREVDYLKHSLEQIAASREKSRAADENWLKDLGPEEVQLIGDILKQYLV